MGLIDRTYSNDIYDGASSKLKNIQKRLDNSELIVDDCGNLSLFDKKNYDYNKMEYKNLDSIDRQKEFRNKNNVKTFQVSRGDSLLEVFLNRKISFSSVIFMISFIFFIFSLIRFIK